MRAELVVAAVGSLWLSSALAADKQALAEDVFKNIQMFKGKPAARVIPGAACAERLVEAWAGVAFF